MQEYYMGLDMGTGSTGWAVTNDKYEVLRAHGKSLWGVRLFETANTAEERRGFRTSRRRLSRRNWRISLLQELFSKDINKIDDGFYLRMKESRYVAKDKQDINGKCPELPYALFTDSDFNDKDYYKKFPTIYHLRNWLIHTDEIPDIRLVYLALHHMMKHRGHFLLSGKVESIREFKSAFVQFVECVKAEELDFSLYYGDEELVKIEEVLKNKDLTKSSRKSELIKVWGSKSKCEKAFCGLISGCTVKLSELFSDTDLDECERPKLAFSDNDYDEYSDVIASELGELYAVIEQAKTIYDWAVLTDILGNHTYLSEAKIEQYEKHKSDLEYLKDLVKENLSKETYREIFVKTDSKLANYCAYIGGTKYNGQKQQLDGKQCNKKDFYAFLKKKVLNVIGENEKTEYLKQEIEKETFLPKQVAKDNSVIPYQVHLQELKAIIDNLSNRIPMLKENAEKIEQIFTFRIPYYVGPLNGIRKGNTTTNWVCRKTNDKIYPWNFEEVVDIEASAERFITRMTNKCTYLPEEDVLPKYSILYSKFEVLNELNNLRLNGELIDVELKQKIFTELFQRTRKVTRKKLLEYLKREGLADKNTEITGVDGDFKSSLTSYHDFKEKLTGCNLSIDDQENIIKNITLFGDDKKLLKKRITRLYPDLSESQIKGLCSLSYKGWGRLSRAFLENITAPAPETGEVWSIIRALWESNDNLMQLLSSKYSFGKILEETKESETAKGLTYEIVDNLYLSPAVKRQVWQTIKIVKELCDIMETPPKRIFIEMAREKQDSKRTESRKMRLIDLYKKCKEEERDWIKELNATEEHKLRRDKLFLYYTQKGRCMYSEEIIPFEDLWDDNKYDIDHIYPQSKVMDDSIDNRVLVKKQYNADKSDTYPIHSDIRRKRGGFWKSLLDGGFISKEKYFRLTRGNDFEESELAGFIARQLVETRQSTKAVASVLKQLLPETEIVYVKSKIVSQFRQEFDLIKVRDMNDLHHAKDAYLNIVAGNIYFTKFTKDAAWFVNKNPGRSYNLKKMFTSNDIARNGEIAWKAGEAGTIQVVKKYMAKNNVLVTRRTYQVKGGLFDQQIMKKGKGQIPIKGKDERLNNIEKYGAYNKASGTYFMLAESEDEKGNKMRTIEFVPLYLASYIEESEENAINYLITERGLKNPKIILKKIKIDTLFKVDGFYMWLSGRSGNQLLIKNANQLLLSNKESEVLKRIIKFVQRQKEIKGLKIVEQDKILEEDLIELYKTFIEKLKDSIYSIKLGAQERTLVDKKKEFLKLTPEDKCVVLLEILRLFQCNSGTANLKLIKGSKEAGKLNLNNNITKCKKIYIINQSPTGIYEQEIDLKTL